MLLSEHSVNMAWCQCCPQTKTNIQIFRCRIPHEWPFRRPLQIRYWSKILSRISIGPIVLFVFLIWIPRKVSTGRLSVSSSALPFLKMLASSVAQIRLQHFLCHQFFQFTTFFEERDEGPRNGIKCAVNSLWQTWRKHVEVHQVRHVSSPEQNLTLMFRSTSRNAQDLLLVQIFKDCRSVFDAIVSTSGEIRCNFSHQCESVT